MQQTIQETIESLETRDLSEFTQKDDSWKFIIPNRNEQVSYQYGGHYDHNFGLL